MSSPERKTTPPPPTPPLSPERKMSSTVRRASFTEKKATLVVTETKEEPLESIERKLRTQSTVLFDDPSDPSLKLDSAGEPQNAVLKFFGGVINAARERFLGDTWWLPSDTAEIVEIPAKYLTVNHSEVIKQAEFVLLKGVYSGANTVYHVAVLLKKDGKMYSVWRSEDQVTAKEHFRGLLPFLDLFKYAECVKDMRVLLTHIAKHPLWKPVHIAARMDLQAFFEEAQKAGDLSGLLNTACQPEGRYPLHLAVYYNYVELTKKLFSYGATVTQTDAKGQTALHYGARTNAAMLEVLCAHPDAKLCMNALNSDGYTPLFIAISACRPACIAALMNRGAVWNITCQGRSALHEAMLQNNNKVIDVVKTLVAACPAAVTEIDPLTGNSLLHTANNKKSVCALITASPSVERNVKNKSGHTPLHWHVQRDDLPMTIAMATYGADLNAQENNGNTALQLAVSRGNIDIVKALLVLGTDPNIVNNFHDSALHLAGRTKHKTKHDIIRCLEICGARRCTPDKPGCTNTCVHTPTGAPPRPPPPYSSMSKSDSSSRLSPDITGKRAPSPDQPPKSDNSESRLESTTQRVTRGVLTELDKFLQQKCVDNVKELKKSGLKLQNVLSLDGGGIRGLVLVQVLIALEKELGEPLMNFIDWLVGTSTGAYLAGALVKGRTLRQCQHMYLQFKDEIFDGWVRPYNAEILERFIVELTTIETTFAHIEKPRLMITTVAADKIPIKLHLFRNYRLPLSDEENEQLGYLKPCDQLLWKALRCSSAAPTYFSSFESKFVDGGLAANNPTTDILVEIQRYNNAIDFKGMDQKEKVRLGCVLSIGTGQFPAVPSESLNFGGMESMSAMRTLSLMLLEQACAAEGGPVEKSRAWCYQIGVPLYRLNPGLSKEYALDTKDDKEIVSMLWEVEEHLRERRSEIRDLAQLLKDLR